MASGVIDPFKHLAESAHYSQQLLLLTVIQTLRWPPFTPRACVWSHKTQRIAIVVQGRRRHPTGTAERGKNRDIEKATTTVREGGEVIGNGWMIDPSGGETATTIGRRPDARTTRDGWTTETKTEADTESETRTGTGREAGVEDEAHRNTETTSVPHRPVQQRPACIPAASREMARTSGAVDTGAVAVANIWKGAWRLSV